MKHYHNDFTRALLEACEAYPGQRVGQVIANAIGENLYYIHDDNAALMLSAYAGRAKERPTP